MNSTEREWWMKELDRLEAKIERLEKEKEILSRPSRPKPRGGKVLRFIKGTKVVKDA